MVLGAVVRVSQKLGSWPMPIMRRLLPGMARSVKEPDTAMRELIEDLKQNKPGDAVRLSSDYRDYIACGSDARPLAFEHQEGDWVALSPAHAGLALSGPAWTWSPGRRRGLIMGHPRRTLEP